MSDVVLARRGREEREFPKKVWDEMPANKYGWLPATEIPEEVKALMEKNNVPSTTEGNSSAVSGLVVSQDEYDDFKAARASIHEREEALNAKELDLNAREEAVTAKEVALEEAQKELEAERLKLSISGNNAGAGEDASNSNSANESGSTDSGKAVKKASK